MTRIASTHSATKLYCTVEEERPDEKRAVAMTTIFKPTASVRAWAGRKDVLLIVGGDKKTPVKWRAKGVVFVSTEAQKRMDSKLLRMLPWNHYCRKMAAYLRAIWNGADVVVDTDDDNCPKARWRIPPFVGKFATTAGHDGWINIYRAYTRRHIWPRGLPLDVIAYWREHEVKLKKRKVRVGIWNGLVDYDPDVDAIYRLTDGRLCTFEKRESIVLEEGTICPFNSQNTIMCKELFPLLYMPATVTIRFTNILRGFVAQPVMWAAGFRLGFTMATAVQKRNIHNYMHDFDLEVPMYRQAHEVVQITRQTVKPRQSVEDNLLEVYRALAGAGIVAKSEISYVEAWLEDLQKTPQS